MLTLKLSATKPFIVPNVFCSPPYPLPPFPSNPQEMQEMLGDDEEKVEVYGAKFFGGAAEKELFVDDFE